MTLNVHVLSDRFGRRLNARVLGMNEGESIIAHVPGSAFSSVDVRLGDELAVRCLGGRTVFGFKTTVIRVCTSPYPYFHLAYPINFQQLEVRQGERVPVTIAAQVKGPNGEELQAEIRDLSGSGALLVTSTELAAQSGELELSFELNLFDVKRPLQLRATVKNAMGQPAGTGDTQRYRYGIQFVELAEQDKLFLLGFIYERLASARGTAIQFS